jgi:hypothetical protein
MAKIIKNGVIYVLMSEMGNVCYYGSTSQIPSQRLTEHRRDYKQFLNNTAKCYMRSCDVLKYPDYKMIILDEYQNITREFLQKEEGYYIEHNECTNKNVAGSTVNPQYAKNYMKTYYNKQKLKKLKENKKIEL